MRILALLLTLAPCACNSQRPAATDASHASPAPAAIGTASMRPDGTVVLRLRAESGAGATGDAELVYPPSHPQYQDVLRHLGGLKAGEEKPVPPWPDEPQR